MIDTSDKRNLVKGTSSKSNKPGISKFSSKQRSNKSYREKRYSEDYGVLPNFVRTRSKRGHGTYDSDLFITMPFMTFYIGTYVANACKQAVIQGYQAGNMKDKVDAQETAYTTMVSNWLQVLFNLGPMTTLRDLMDNPPESDAISATGDGETGNTNMALYTYLNFNAILSELQGKIIPNVVIELFKAFNFYIKFGDPYQIGAVEIPGQYYLPFYPKDAYTTLSTVATGALDLIYAQQGQAKRHMDKFGIKYSKFDVSLLTPREIDQNHPDAIAWFNHAPLTIAGSGVAGYCPGGYDAAGDVVAGGIFGTGGLFYTGAHSNVAYFFKDNPNESVIHVLAPLLDMYHATNNPYGWMFNPGTFISTTAKDTGLKASQVEASEFLGADASEMTFSVTKYLALYTQTNLIDLSYTGTNIAETDIAEWPLAATLDLKYGRGLSQNVIDNALLRQLMKWSF